MFVARACALGNEVAVATCNRLIAVNYDIQTVSWLTIFNNIGDSHREPSMLFDLRNYRVI